MKSPVDPHREEAAPAADRPDAARPTAAPQAPAAGPAHALEVRDLAHTFKAHQALDNVTFDVPSASIHGFVGPNGAGKTTTLKVIATLLRPQVGIVRVFGHDVVQHPTHVRRLIGFMPDYFGLYPQMTVFEYLDFFAAAYGLSLRRRNRTITDVLALTDMAGRKDDLIRNLSRGMQQRVSLARVLVHDPDLLLLDEPASGLDPRARIELMEILRELQRLGKTIFISSHILSELATLCDAVTIIDRGHIKYSGSIQELLALTHGGTTYQLTLAEPSPAVEEALRQAEGVVEVKQAEADIRYTLTFDPDAADTNRLLTIALDAGGQVVDFRRAERHLNEAFMDLTEAGVRS